LTNKTLNWNAQYFLLVSQEMKSESSCYVTVLLDSCSCRSWKSHFWIRRLWSYALLKLEILYSIHFFERKIIFYTREVQIVFPLFNFCLKFVKHCESKFSLLVAVQYDIGMT